MIHINTIKWTNTDEQKNKIIIKKLEEITKSYEFDMDAIKTHGGYFNYKNGIHRYQVVNRDTFRLFDFNSNLYYDMQLKAFLYDASVMLREENVVFDIQ